MRFNSSPAIYLQIADYVYDSVLAERWKPGDRIPSVRDLAVSLEVNPNTVMRTFSLLQNEGVISNQRGIGFFLSDDAVDKVRQARKNDFYENVLPEVFRTMSLLGIAADDLTERFSAYRERTED
jgi:GntR family transcriptional regulator